MKKLFIIRHAKSSWKDSALDDFDRPLSKRGKSDAPMIGSRLRERNIYPDIIISSPAKRAKTTAEIIAKELKYSKDILLEDEVYESTLNKLQKIVTKVDDNNSTLFLVGHNTSLNILAWHYVDFSENIVTCGVLEIEFDCDRWKDASDKNAKLISYDYPKKMILNY